MKYLKIYYRLLVYLTCFTVFWRNQIKKALKMTSQLVIFKSLFIRPPNLLSEKKILLIY